MTSKDMEGCGAPIAAACSFVLAILIVMSVWAFFHTCPKPAIEVEKPADFWESEQGGWMETTP